MSNSRYIEIMTDNPSEGYDFPCFAFDTKQCVALNTAYIMTGDVEELHHILGILNSKVGRLLVKYYVVQLQQRQFRMLNQYVVNFPIPKLAKENVIADLVKQLLRSKSKKDERIENEINSAVYQIFAFDTEEINFIESL